MDSFSKFNQCYLSRVFFSESILILINYIICIQRFNILQYSNFSKTFERHGMMESNYCSKHPWITGFIKGQKCSHFYVGIIPAFFERVSIFDVVITVLLFFFGKDITRPIFKKKY